MLEHAFARQADLAGQIIGTIKLDVHATESHLIEAARPALARAAYDRETEAVRALREALGAAHAVAGTDALVNALQEGETGSLVLKENFHAAGWADYTFPVYGAGATPKEHPIGGDVSNIAPIALEEEFVRLAIQTDADIVFVRAFVDADTRSEPAEVLDKLGGVGAILKFVP